MSEGGPAGAVTGSTPLGVSTQIARVNYPELPTGHSPLVVADDDSPVCGHDVGVAAGNDLALAANQHGRSLVRVFVCLHIHFLLCCLTMRCYTPQGSPLTTKDKSIETCTF